MLNHSGQKSSSDTLAESQKWIAYVFAGLMVFFATPILVQITNPYISNFTAYHYGSELVGLASVIWWGISAAGIFFLSNAIAISLIRVAFQKFFIRIFR